MAIWKGVPEWKDYLIQSAATSKLLKLHLAVLTLVGGHFVSATYNLEGDKCCSLVTYHTIKDCESWLNDHYDYLTYPGIAAEIEDCVTTLIGGNESYEGMGVDELKADLRQNKDFS